MPKHSTNDAGKLRRLIGSLSALPLLVLSASAAPAADDPAHYGTRASAVCEDRSQPEGDTPMTVELATRYVRCGIDAFSLSYLYLAENIKLQLGKPRPYRMEEDYLRSNIDTDALVWPVRGSYDRYQCMKVADYGAGTNCNYYEKPKATGACYKDLFGDWHCSLSGTDGEVRMNVAPPG